MTLMPNVVRTRPNLCTAIEAELRTMIESRAQKAQAYGPEFGRLWAIAGENVLGGKFVRPLLLVETYDALAPGAKDREAAISIAAAIELLHYAFLLHDDVIDGDLVRRGRPNLIGALLAEAGQLPLTGERPDAGRPDSALHWAQTGGILMGDMLLAATHQAFARVELAHPLRLRLLDLLEHTINETVAGEQLDVGLGDGIVAPELETILKMCGYKDPFSDLREGKQTAIIAYARKTSAWAAIEPSFGRPDLAGAEAEEVRRQLSECGAETFVQGHIDQQTRAFRELVSTEHIPAQVRSVLVDLSGHLEGRQS